MAPRPCGVHFISGSRSSFYGGVGPTLVVWDWDRGKEDLEIGLSLLAGIRFPFGRNHLYKSAPT